MVLEIGDKAEKFLIDQGTDLEMGARPLRRAVERHLEDALSEELLRGQFDNATRIIVEYEEGAKALTFTGVSDPAEVSST
jgi:ATP-dependent Clp protease ATP-binding subunit ClpC